ncbi:unnamed protein product [Brachionus calyciflorus]|uniref:CUB domain-containing protein n=1 Tax=Brachionus calyciflorus TaxID=104777 RepID=A0A813MCS5_9BILA|nr:unnamed protein product [Brachionus calyciflorus]
MCILTLLLVCLLHFNLASSSGKFFHSLRCKPLENLNLDEDSVFKKNYSNFGYIQSPNYLDKYDKNTVCYFLIHAPRNHKIVLTHMEKFSIEPSVNCVHDYLEIRNGKFGFDPLIGRYCDGNLPIFPIYSTGRNLWIKFFSDDSIELNGFRIYYELKKSIQKNELDYETYLKLSQEILKCDMNLIINNEMDTFSGALTNHDIEAYFIKNYNNFKNYLLRTYNSFDFRPVLDCTVFIETDIDKKIFIGIEHLNIVSISQLTSLKEAQTITNCTENFFQIYDHNTSEQNRKIHLCSGQKKSFYKSITNKVVLRFNFVKYSDNDSFRFKIFFNPFTDVYIIISSDINNHSFGLIL